MFPDESVGIVERARLITAGPGERGVPGAERAAPAVCSG